MRDRSYVVLKLFASLFLVYALLRLAFLFVYFPAEEWTFWKSLQLFYWGWRMDLAALFYLNVAFLAWYFFGDPFIRSGRRHIFSLVLFSLLNLPFLALNFTDLVYYGFNHRRSTVDLVQVMAGSSGAYGAFFARYWYVLLVFVLLAYSLVRRWKYYLSATGTRQSSLPAYFISSLLFLGLLGMLARGFSRRPLLPSTALLYFDARYQPLVNNSSFNFLYSLLRKQTVVKPRNYFSPRELDRLMPVQHQYPQDSAFDRKNVVFFVLESFSREFFPGGSQRARMPFFDSLMGHSTVFSNAYCNALESNKGLPAILASLPDVMDEPIYLSNYSHIPFRGIGHILREQGYRTSFFLGAEYDHFGFARLSKMVGIEHYYSREDYGKREDHEDGTWGIYDEYFFPFFADVLDRQPEPFFSVLFNISSHAPYTLPEHAARRLRVPGQQPHQDAVTYVDDCFNQLFKRIRNAPWFRNTIFVFVADHGYRYTVRSDNRLSELRIPLFIYEPASPRGRVVNRVVKQLDLVPSVLDRLRYPGRFTAFGASFYRPGPSFSVNRLNGVLQYVDSTDFLGLDEETGRPVFHYRPGSDSLLRFNLLGTTPDSLGRGVNQLKALLQRMNNSLDANKFD